MYGNAVNVEGMTGIGPLNIDFTGINTAFTNSLGYQASDWQGPLQENSNTFPWWILFVIGAVMLVSETKKANPRKNPPLYRHKRQISF